MKSLIYGYGKTGKSFERYLANKNLEFEIFDANVAKFNKEYNVQHLSSGLYHLVIQSNFQLFTTHCSLNAAVSW